MIRWSETHITSKQIEHGASKRPVVHRRPVRLPAQIFRSEVLPRTGKFVGVFPPAPDWFVVNVCGPVIEYLDVVASVDQNVLRFDVPVDDSHVVQCSNPESHLGNPFFHPAGVNLVDEERLHVRAEVILECDML